MTKTDLKPPIAQAGMAKVIKAAEQIAADPPKELTRTITLRGPVAARYALAEAIMREGLSLSEEESAAYLLQAGADREIDKLAGILGQIFG